MQAQKHQQTATRAAADCNGKSHQQWVYRHSKQQAHGCCGPLLTVCMWVDQSNIVHHGAQRMPCKRASVRAGASKVMPVHSVQCCCMQYCGHCCAIFSSIHGHAHAEVKVRNASRANRASLLHISHLTACQCSKHDLCKADKTVIKRFASSALCKLCRFHTILTSQGETSVTRASKRIHANLSVSHHTLKIPTALPKQRSSYPLRSQHCILVISCSAGICYRLVHLVQMQH